MKRTILVLVAAASLLSGCIFQGNPFESPDDATTEDICVPDCKGKNCGDDGCGGNCGECTGCKSVCSEGQCEAQPQADSGCFDNDIYWKDSCGAWGEKATECGERGCNPGSEVCAECEEICSGSECGTQGDCNCGTCPDGQSCDDGGQCQVVCGDGVCAQGIEDYCNCSQDCPASTCAGCCAGTECKIGDTPLFCGSEGEACDECVVGEVCQGGDCVCTPEHHKGCSGGKLYWYDSCDVQGIEEDDCDDENFCTTDGCSGSQCTHSNKGNDTPCGNDKSCQSGVCAYHCGDDLCADAGGGEDCDTCPADCGQCPECDLSCDLTLEECVQATTGGGVCTSKMVDIPAGNFWMGCNDCPGTDPAAQDTLCQSDEHPYHEVYLDAYEIDRTEVTAAQYLACKTAGGCTAAGSGSYATYEVPGKEDHPVNYVTWSQAEDYCQWVGKELCTEAQWEKGARGGCEKNGGPSNCKAQSRKYPWGNETPTCDLAVKGGCGMVTQPVCSVSPAGDSPYGLCDMAGNVWEWTADWYRKDYYCDGDGASGDEYCTACGSWPGSPNAWSDPFCTISGSCQVVRGGSFGNYYDSLRVSNRDFYDPSVSYGGLGGRCCRSE